MQSGLMKGYMEWRLGIAGKNAWAPSVIMAASSDSPFRLLRTRDGRLDRHRASVRLYVRLCGLTSKI